MLRSMRIVMTPIENTDRGDAKHHVNEKPGCKGSHFFVTVLFESKERRHGRASQDHQILRLGQVHSSQRHGFKEANPLQGVAQHVRGDAVPPCNEYQAAARQQSSCLQAIQAFAGLMIRSKDPSPIQMRSHEALFYRVYDLFLARAIGDPSRPEIRFSE